MKLRGLKSRQVAKLLGVDPSYISQILSGKKASPSGRILIIFDGLEREANCDPFLAACAAILQSDNDRVVEGFTMNIYSVLGNIDRKESERLKEIEAVYLEERKHRKRALEAG